MGNMAIEHLRKKQNSYYEIREIRSHIVQFVTNNPECNVRTMIEAIRKTQKISPSKVFPIYRNMIYHKHDNPDGMIIVNKPIGFRGGNEAFQLIVRKTTIAGKIVEIVKLIDRYHKDFKRFMPQMRQNKLLTKKVVDGHKYQVLDKKYVSDFNVLMSLIDTVYQRVSALAMANAMEVTPKGYDKEIENLQKMCMGWIILEINRILDEQSKLHDVTRWNVLINIRLRLEWLVVFEYSQPDLFFKGDWLKDGVIIGPS